MQIIKSKVEEVKKITGNIFLLKAHSPQIASEIKPGQFCNIKVSETDYPLLRRPFSICDVDGEYIFFLFDVHGEGTRILSEKKNGDEIDILGPLGNGFNIDGDFDTAVFAAGGIGIAPFPLMTRKLKGEKEIISMIGGRSKDSISLYGIENYSIATDDGSEGLHGTVIDLLNENISTLTNTKSKIFACGPNPMFRALKDFCIKNNIECQISTESAMACGFGICQGCNIEKSDGSGYQLICKDGPVFDIKEVNV